MIFDPLAYWNKLSEKGKYLGHVIGATGLIFFFILIGSSFQVNIKALNPLTRSLVDYEVTDIVFSKFRDQSLIDFEDQIILVNTGKPDRIKIATALERLNGFQPKAIGIDLLFTELKDSLGDVRLAKAIDEADDVVLASVLGNYNSELDVFEESKGSHPMFKKGTESGYTNFVAKPDHTIRLFSIAEPTETGQEMAFAVALAKIADSEKVESLMGRHKSVERINYRGNSESFVLYDIDQLLDEQLDPSAIIKDKIVLMGYMGDDEWSMSSRDKFYTPLNDKIAVKSLPDMHGIVIHANILSMILNGSYITEVPDWLNRLLEFIIVMLCVALIRMDYISFKSTYWIIIRVMQIAVFIMLFYLVAGFFYLFNIRLNLTLGIIGALMAWDTVDFYENLVLPWTKRNIAKFYSTSKIENTEISLK